MRRLVRAASAAALAAMLFSTRPSDARSLRVEGGDIADAAADASGIRVFKGIPYAAPVWRAALEGAADHHLADVMTSYWTNFAKTGDSNGTGLPRWPACKAGGGGRVMELGATIEPEAEVHRDRYEFFDGYYRKVATQ